MNGRCQKKKTGKISVNILENEQEGAGLIASVIARMIRDKAAAGETAVLGLATGSSPVNVYRELIKLHNEEGLSFRNVITFNLDEYFPMSPDSDQSYHHFMYDNLFDHIDIDPANVNIPDGTLREEEVAAFCASYDEKIKQSGGIDIQLLGIGRSGHIGFNEPGSQPDSPTRMIQLHGITITDAAKDFGGEDKVPQRAITMGMAPVLGARKILLAAWGEKKASIVKKMIEGPITTEVPASFLQQHDNVTVYLDKPATAELAYTK